MGLYSAIIIQPPVEMKRHVAQRSKKPAPVFFLGSIQFKPKMIQNNLFFSHSRIALKQHRTTYRDRERENERDWNREKKHGTLLQNIINECAHGIREGNGKSSTVLASNSQMHTCEFGVEPVENQPNRNRKIETEIYTSV